MSLTKILNKKDANPEEVLEAVAEIVAKARKAYGNEDSEIEVPTVQTPYGVMPFVHLEDDSKVVMLRATVQDIKAKAVEFLGQNPAGNMNKKVEELIACNPMLTNVDAGAKFDYL